MTKYTMRARDVRFKINELGTEKGIIYILERLAEDNEHMKQEMSAVVRTVDKMADIVANIATVGERLKKDWAAVRKAMHPDKEELQ
jgi:hypothetical protein